MWTILHHSAFDGWRNVCLEEPGQCAHLALDHNTTSVPITDMIDYHQDNLHSILVLLEFVHVRYFTCKAYIRLSLVIIFIIIVNCVDMIILCSP